MKTRYLYVKISEIKNVQITRYFSFSSVFIPQEHKAKKFDFRIRSFFSSAKNDLSSALWTSLHDAKDRGSWPHTTLLWSVIDSKRAIWNSGQHKHAGALDVLVNFLFTAKYFLVTVTIMYKRRKLSKLLYSRLCTWDRYLNKCAPISLPNVESFRSNIAWAKWFLWQGEEIAWTLHLRQNGVSPENYVRLQEGELKIH